MKSNPLMITVAREYLIRQLWNNITSEKDWRYQSIIGDTWDALGYPGFVNHIHHSESVAQDNESYALACGTVTLLILAAEGELT
jgi:hypothetical protein